jgi:hypothetical protein
MTTTVKAETMLDAMHKLTDWREELEKVVPLGNLKKSGKLIRQYAKTKDDVTLMEAIMKLEFEIDYIASKQGKVLLQEEMQWTLVG